MPSVMEFDQALRGSDLMPTDRERTELAICVEVMTVAPYWHAEEKAPRLQRAHKWVLDGKVEALEKGYYRVAGSKPGTFYTLKGTDCECEHAQHAKTKWCYHAVSVKLYQEWQRRLGPLVPQQPGLGLPPTTVDERLASSTTTPAQEPAMDTPSTPEVIAPALATVPALTLPRRSITAIIADLSKPLPQDCLVIIKRDGRDIPGLHWYTVRTLLDTYAPGWQSRITTLQVDNDVCRVVCRLGIPCLEGIVWREGTGEKDDWEADPKQYGNPAANAEANAFKRAASKFGVGAYLYAKDQTETALLRHLKAEKTRLLGELGKVLDERQMPRGPVLEWLKWHTGADRAADIPLAAIQTVLAQLTVTA